MIPTHLRSALLFCGLVGVGSSVMGTGCSKQSPPRVERSVVYLEELSIQRSFTADGLLLEEFDINRDGIVDNYSYSQPLDKYGDPLEDLSGYTPYSLPNFRLVRRELDLNFDGKTDFVRHYDVRGNIARDEVDTDFNGAYDRVAYYSSNVITRRDIDADENGVIEESRFYVSGQLFRIERDENQDGQTDYWQFFNEGVLTRAGYDRDGDRIIDEWLISSQIGALRDRIARDEADQPNVDE